LQTDNGHLFTKSLLIKVSFKIVKIPMLTNRKKYIVYLIL